MVIYMIKILYNEKDNIDEDILYSTFADIIKSMQSKEEDDTDEE